MVTKLENEVRAASIGSSSSLSSNAKSSCEMPAGSQGADTAGSIGVPDHPWRIKGPAIFLTLFLTLGSDYASSIIPPLKSSIKEKLAINDAQYAVANSLINTVVPIVSGAAIDYYGPLALGVFALSFILTGAVITAVATQINHYPLMVGGQIIKGLGATTIETVQSKIYSWYSVGMMAFIYGIDISIGRAYTFAGTLSAVPILSHTGHISRPFWASAILCGVSWVFMIGLFLYERTFPDASRVPTGRRVAKRDAKDQGVDIPSLGVRARTQLFYFTASVFAIPAAFWIMDISQLLQAGAVSAYTSNLADVIKVTRNASNESAGYSSAIGQVIPIVLVPCLGALFDQWGHRMHWVTATALVYILVFYLLAFTTVDAIVPSILGSLALATNVLPWIASVPLLVPDQRNLGAAFGVYRALTSCGTVIVSISSGAIQNHSGPSANQYDNVFYFLIVIKTLDAVYGVLYHQFDKQCLDGVLVKNDLARSKTEAAQTEEERTRGVKGAVKEVTVVALGVVVSMIVIAWVISWVYWK